ncbi:MAG: right-handed parallel beta-helix repeat-containing protein [Methanosarcinaceae archaeon]|nr:right-handed parallel beta-helix repeat-containing protein [Methanosarcinaceae archaeon]
MKNICNYFVFVFFLLILSCTVLLAEGATITVPDQYPTIQQAINNSAEDDIIIVTGGPYEERISVDKRLNITGFGMPKIDGEWVTGTNTVTLNASGILFSGFNVTNGRSSGIEIISDDVEVNNCTVCFNRNGIELTGVNGVVLQDNDIRDSSGSYGIYLSSSSNNVIQNNTVENSNAYNMELEDSSSNIITNNIFSSAGWHGVVFSDSSEYNTFSGNVIEENSYGHGIQIYDSDSNVFRDNIVQNNSLDDSYTGIYVNTVLNLTFINNTLSGNNLYGFYLYDCEDSHFSNNTVRNTLKSGSDYSTGFYLDSSNWNTLENNTIADNEHRGLFFKNSRYNTLTGNNITGNPYNFGVTVDNTISYFVNYINTSNLVDGKPIIYLVDDVNSSVNGSSNAGAVYCVNCDGVVVEGLTLTGNSYGIVLYNSVNSTIQENTVTSCEEGIFLIASHNNTITQNNASYNQDYGIRVRSSNYNEIYLNNFANNSNKDYRSDSSETTWRSPIELLYFFGGEQNTSYLGNYWGSYTGSDNDDDGIGDTTFSITNDNDDEYPLISSKGSYSFSDNQPPVADFTYSPILPDTDDVISFTDASVDIDGSVGTWSWDFGDGNTSSQQNPTHQYNTSGFFDVVLNVTDNDLDTGNTTTTIFVHAAGSMTIYVPDNFSTIQEAVYVSRNGDTVLVFSGTYPENVIVNRSISVIGEGIPLVNSTGGTGFTVTSEACTIEGFNITNANGIGYAGIKLESDQNVLRNNSLVGNYYGIYLASSDNNTLFNNSCMNNTDSGICLSSSMNSTIFNNTCNNNSAFGGGEGGQGYGISLEDSGGNTLYFNDLDNPNQNVPGMYYNAFDSNTSGTINYWFNSTLLKGNRYSDYRGSDNNSDGIGDTPYEIDYDSGDVDVPGSDPYPLMPFEPFPEFEPIISGIGTGDLTYGSITIHWSITNEIVSDNRVLYATNESLAGAEWSIWDNSTISPQIGLSGLLQNTTYYYECYSYNEDNSSVYDNSSVRSFTTIQRPNLILTVDDDDADIPEPPANYSSLTAALNAAIDGDTILVYNGTYRNNHVVDKSLNITGIGWPVLAGSEEETLYDMGDVVTLESDGCILQGFRIIDAHWHNTTISRSTDAACIRIGSVQYNINLASWSYSDSDNNLIQNNILDDGVFGIYVNRYSTDNQIIANRLNDTYEGVLFDYAQDNTFEDNNLTNIEHYPIKLTRLTSASDPISTNITICNNTISDESDSWGIELDRVSDNTIVNNTLYSNNLIEIIGDRNSITGNSVLGPNDYHKAGIHVGSGEDNILLNNTVSLQKFGILLTPYTEDVTMRGNRMENNTYNFGFTGEWTYGSHRASTHTIDTSNTINDDPVYYFIGEKDSVYSYSTLTPSPGYLACIDCSNITINDFYMENNAQGLFLHNTTDSYIDGVTTHSNAESGILLYDADNLRISNSNIDSNGQSPSSSYAGIFLEETSGCLMDNNTITGNSEIGIRMWYGCPDAIVSNCEISNNGDPADPGTGIGIYISGSYADNVTIHSNTISNTHDDLQGFGIHNEAENSTIYNNYFNNTQDDAFSAAPGTSWNITPTAGTNIIGCPWIAGNFWSGYTGEDTDHDGLGDTLVPYNISGEIQENGDYHPLLDTFIPDTTAPDIYVTSPVEGNTYVPQLVYLRVSSTDGDTAFWWYSLNSNENISFTPDTILTGLPLGANTLQVYVNDTSGNENSTMVNFTVVENTTPTGDNDDGDGVNHYWINDDNSEEEPEMYEEITIISPEAGRTIHRNMNLNYSSPIPLARVYYSVDHGDEHRAQPGITIPIKRLALGEHVINVKGVDYYGNSIQGAVLFEVVPMAIGEIPVTGTPDYPDETVFSFIGRPVKYTLSFEAENIEEGEVSVYLNRYLAGVFGENSSMGSSREPGGLVYTPGTSSGWSTYAVEIPADLIAPNSENLLSFIHSTNPDSSGTLDSWSVRNIAIVQETPVSYPDIRVFTTDRAISSGEELMSWVDISGITDDRQYEAEVYLVDPEGNVISFPDGEGTVKPLDSSYVKNNHYGRIPGSLTFNEGFIPGTYRLIGSLTSEGSGSLDSLSSTIIYYNDQPSVKLFMNRESYSPGMPVTVDMAITKGENPENAYSVVLLERPDSSELFLPYRTETYSSLQYQPLMSQYMTVYDEMVTADWEDGMYSVRCSVFNESGYVLSSDVVSFEVCKEECVVSILFGATGDSQIIYSSIRLIDDVTFDIAASGSVTGPHTSVEVGVPVGTYWITGEIRTEDGKIYTILLNTINRVEVSSPEKKVTKKVSFSMNPLTIVMTGGEVLS